MAEFQWPASPSIGDEVIGPGGQLYRWDGEKWVAVQEGRFAPLVNPTLGQNNYSPFDIDGGDY